MEECKLLKGHSTKYAAQQPYKEEASSGGNRKQGKIIQFDGTTENVNSMTAPDAPILRNQKGEIQTKKPKSDKDTAIPEEKEHTYRIDCLNLRDLTVESDNDSE